MKKRTAAVIAVLLLSICAVYSALIYHGAKKLPEKINIYENESRVIDLSVPIIANVEITGASSSNSVKAINFSEPISFQAGEIGEYSLKLKLLGLFDIKEMTVSVISQNQLLPCGFPVGIYLKTDGILVIDTTSFTDSNGNIVNPCENKLLPGDYITGINGYNVSNKAEFIKLLSESDFNNISLNIRRQNEPLTVNLDLYRDASDIPKLGIWIRDDAQGIGTLTFIDSNGNFGALGHGISDVDTGSLLTAEYGKLYNAKILSIHKGQNGSPGEMIGSINYNENNRIGSIYSNKNIGIYGKIDDVESIASAYGLSYLDIGFLQDIRKDKAYIQTCVDNQIERYEIQITNINGNDPENKHITFVVTDEKLLGITNGIVQGMSGSPIIQDDKIIGAVTHVFVDDSTSGYAILIEKMLEN